MSKNTYICFSQDDGVYGNDDDKDEDNDDDDVDDEVDDDGVILFALMFFM